MSKNKHWLDEIEDLDNDSKTKLNDENDIALSKWLTASNEPKQENLLDGIYRLDITDKKQLLQSFCDSNVGLIIKKQIEYKPLTNSELALLNEFKDTFPQMTDQSLKEAFKCL